ncbi:hypothetical protein SAMN04487981_102251 [Streptomyces sp. cf386]|uniref:DUF6333 family protein n=1 Tax=Streptomyces sp. cf386 TaxID=1761904 RepID=UPI00088D24C3|nr:DUF6333 family protein [Streptomyces sp. cf386]SDM68468.1 hypothetical protein SAMN04487981_102251 [Streptomyces sp. cf386]
MADTTFWTCPPDREVQGRGDDCTLTLLLPPFPTGTVDFSPHNPAEARHFAENFATVDEILEELPPISAAASPALWTRADLDIIKVGCWGNVISITDPALADNIGDLPLLGASTKLRERHPDARIVGSANVDCGEDHTEDIIQLPGGLMVHTEGWPGVEPLDVTGDPRAVVRALGISSETLADEAIDLDEESDEIDWRALGRLALGPCDPWGRPDLTMSVFRVRHTSGSTYRMEESWFWNR